MYFIEDLFAIRPENIKISIDGEGGEAGYPASPYIMSRADSMEEVDNWDLDSIAPSIKQCPFSELYSSRVTNLVLELLKYYDKHGNIPILDVSTDLLNYVALNDPTQSEICEINRLQVEKRRRKLSKEENKYLMGLKAPGNPLQFQLAACILLESFREAAVLYDQLSDEEKAQFDDFPIKYLWANDSAIASKNN